MMVQLENLNGQHRSRGERREYKDWQYRRGARQSGRGRKKVKLIKRNIHTKTNRERENTVKKCRAGKAPCKIVYNTHNLDGLI